MIRKFLCYIGFHDYVSKKDNLKMIDKGTYSEYQEDAWNECIFCGNMENYHTDKWIDWTQANLEVISSINDSIGKGYDIVNEAEKSLENLGFKVCAGSGYGETSPGMGLRMQLAIEANKGTYTKEDIMRILLKKAHKDGMSLYL